MKVLYRSCRNKLMAWQLIKNESISVGTELYEKVGFKPNAYEKLQLRFKELQLSPPDAIKDLIAPPWEKLVDASWDDLQKIISALRRKAINLENTGIQAAEEKSKELKNWLTAVEEVLKDPVKRKEYGEWVKKQANRPPPVPVNTQVLEPLDPLQECRHFLALGDIDKALRAATRATQEDPENVDVWELLGQINIDINNVSGAINAYQRVLELSLGEKQARPHFILGIIYGEIGDSDEALKHYKEAEKIAPSIKYRAAIGELYCKTKRYDEAIPLMERCVKEDPNNTPYQEILAKSYYDGVLLYLTPEQGNDSFQFFVTEGRKAYKAQKHLKRAAALPLLNADFKTQINARLVSIQRAFHRDWPAHWWGKGAWIVILVSVLGIVQFFLHDIGGGLYFLMSAGLYVVSAREPYYLVQRKQRSSATANLPISQQNGCFSFLLVAGSVFFLPVPIVWNFLRNYITAPLAPTTAKIVQWTAAGVFGLFVLGCVLLLSAFGTFSFSLGPFAGSGFSTIAFKVPAPGSHLTSYQNQQGTVCVDYISPDGHVHELLSSGSKWLNTDITAASKGATAIPGSTLVGYANGNNQYVAFISADHHVHELAFSGSNWSDTDLTVTSHGGNVVAGSTLVSYTGGGSTQHINFISPDSHVHELYYSGSSWVDNDLTALSDGAKAISGSPLAGYIGSDGSIHVNFIGTDSHVHELYFTGRWTDNDLTALSKGQGAVAGSALVGYWGADNSVHVDFISADQHIHELFFDPQSGHWNDNDLTVASNGSTAAPGSGLVGYIGDGSSQYIDFIGADHHVHELFFTGTNWNDNDLTTAAKSVLPDTGSGIAGYIVNGKEHIDFIGTDHHIYEIFA